MRPRILRPTVIAFSAFLLLALPARSAAAQANTPQQNPHNTPEWIALAPHLPALDTATAAQLETAGDVLCARGYQQDALRYYAAALERGGDRAVLLNKMGVIRLEMNQYGQAREIFKRVVHMEKRDAKAWNNLGAAEYMRGRYGHAASDYRRATKIDDTSAVFYANLGLVYFQQGDIMQARRSFMRALTLDPRILDVGAREGMAPIAGTADYPRLCYEFARLAAADNDPVQTRLWLSKALYAGFDIRDAMTDDPVMKAYLQDPEVQLILNEDSAMRSRNFASSPANGAGNGRTQPMIREAD